MLRRMFALVAVLFLFALAPMASAKTVINERQSFTQLVGEWYEEGDDGWFTFGYAVATAQDGDTWIEYYQESTRTIACDGSEGYEYMVEYGYGEGTLSAARQFTRGHAEGLIIVSSESGSYCFDEGDGPEPFNGSGDGEEKFISIDFTATSSLYREKGSGSFKVPGEWNEHYRFSSTYRLGEATVSIDSDTFTTQGIFGQVVARYHVNG